MDKTSNDPVRGNGHARAVQRLPARRVRDFSWPCSRVNLRGGAQKAAVARNRATFAWPCAATPCTRQVGPTSLGRGTVAGEGNDVHGPPALSPTVHRACESGAGGVVVRAPRMRAWCGETALLAIRAAGFSEILRLGRFPKLSRGGCRPRARGNFFDSHSLKCKFLSICNQ